MHGWAFGLLELHVFALVVLWSVRFFFSFYSNGIENSGTGLLDLPHLNLPIAFFIGLVVFQLVPLDVSIVTFLSPSTAELYQQFLPDWPRTSAPLALNRYATSSALGKLWLMLRLFSWS